MKMDNVQFILSILAAIGGLASTLLVVGFIVGGYKHRFEELEAEVGGLKRAFMFLIFGLGKTKSIDQSTSDNIVGALHVRATGNPISQEEADKINSYIVMARGGKEFTKEQAKEFFDLARKFDDDPDVKRSDQGKISFDVVLLATATLGKYG